MTRKLILLPLCLLLIVQSLSFNVIAAETGVVVYEQTFDELTTKSLASEMQISKGTDISVEVIKEGEGNALLLHRGSAADGSVGVAKGFSTLKSRAVIEFRVMSKSPSMGWRSLYFGNAINLYISGLSFGSHQGATQPSYGQINLNEWNDIKIDANIPSNTYDLYLNYVLVAKDVPFRNKTTALETLSFSYSVAGDLYLDDFIITSYPISGRKAGAASIAEAEAEAEAEVITKNAPKAEKGQELIVTARDSFITMKANTKPVGKAESISVCGDATAKQKRAYLGFDGVSDMSGKRARLMLYLNPSEAELSQEILSLYEAENNWTESELISNNEPIITDTVASLDMSDITDGWISFDITDFLREKSGKPFSLMLAVGTKLEGSGRELVFDSREGICVPHIILEQDNDSAEGVTSGTEAFSLEALSGLCSKLARKETVSVAVISDSAESDNARPFFKMLEKKGGKLRYISYSSKELTSTALNRVSLLKLLAGEKPDLIVLNIADLRQKQVIQLAEVMSETLQGTEWMALSEGLEDYSENGIILASDTALEKAYPTYTVAKIAATEDINGSENVKTNPIIYDIPENICIETFDQYTAGRLGEAWRIEQTSMLVTAEEDKLCGGRYMRVQKLNPAGEFTANKYTEPVGGPLQISFQMAVYDKASDARINVTPYPYESAKLMSLSLSNGNLMAGSTQIYTLEVGKWYNISIQFDFDKGKYNVLVDGTPCLTGGGLTSIVNVIDFIQFSVPDGATADFGIDNLYFRYFIDGDYTVEEAPAGSGIFCDMDFTDDSGAVATDTAGKIYYETEDGNTFIRADRNSESGGCSTTLGYSKTEGDLRAEFAIRVNDLTYATKILYFQNSGKSLIQLYFSEDKLYEMRGSTRSVLYSGLEAEKWYQIRMDISMSSQYYDVYIDGRKIASAVTFNSSGVSLDSLRYAITAGDVSSFDMDNFKIITLPQEEAKQEEIAGYYNNYTEPTMTDWIEKFQSAPTGMVIEAEDMELYNYISEPNLKAHNGKGIYVPGIGFGSASFKFEGQSGYYAINVAYYEGDGSTASYYYLKQNGERIDYWLGLFNDSELHVRNAKEYHYIKKGDIISICGSGGQDPSSLDYIEFKPGIRRDFRFGDLIMEDSYLPGRWRSSGWDADEEGGSVRNGVHITDMRPDASTAAIRRVSPFYSDWTLDLPFTMIEMSSFDVVIGEGEKYPIRVKIADGKVSAGDKYYENTIAPGEKVLLRIAANSSQKTYTVLVNGDVLAQDIPFSEAVSQFDVLKLITDSEGTANFSANYILMTAGYLLNETFRGYAAGKAPYDWQLSGSGEVKSMNSQGSDTQSFVLNSGGALSKSFASMCGTFTYEAMLLLPEKADGAGVKLSDGLGASIGIITKDGNFCYTDGKGGTYPLWENYKENIWYQIKIVVDEKTKQADFSVNDFKLIEDVPIVSAKFDTVLLQASPKSGDVWLDDILLFAGEYFSDVPDAEIPEMKGDYNIAMMSCDLWKEGTHFGYDVLSSHDSRMQLLGYQEDGNNESADWEMKYMLEHGVNIYLPCWYIPDRGGQEPIKDPRNSAKLNQGYMNSKFRNQMRFALNVTTVDTSDLEKFYTHQVRYWIERYFKHPSYWVEDNKPVICIFGTESFPGAASIFAVIDEMLKEEGFDGGIFVGVTSTLPGYDYYYSYGLGAGVNGNTVINTVLDRNASVPYIPSVSQGWGNEVWGRTDKKTNMPLADWRGSLEWIRDKFFPVVDGLNGKTVFLGNWNELAEGHFLTPTKLAGFAYLDIVRKVFTEDTPHVDVIPEKRFDWMTPILW